MYRALGAFRKLNIFGCPSICVEVYKTLGDIHASQNHCPDAWISVVSNGSDSRGMEGRVTVGYSFFN
tara:strand:- start:180 stop:380 length:201 start_codon:yes stop_codon:yes gene_type:complete